MVRAAVLLRAVLYQFADLLAHPPYPWLVPRARRALVRGVCCGRGTRAVGGVGVLGPLPSRIEVERKPRPAFGWGREGYRPRKLRRLFEITRKLRRLFGTPVTQIRVISTFWVPPNKPNSNPKYPPLSDFVRVRYIYKIFP